jgi:hypothetical protein
MWITLNLTNGTRRQLNAFSIRSVERWNGITYVQYGTTTYRVTETVDEVERLMGL